MKASAAHAAAVVLLVATAGAFTTAQAQVDFTGQWAPLYQEDTIERDSQARSSVTTRACRSPRPAGFAPTAGTPIASRSSRSISAGRTPQTTDFEVSRQSASGLNTTTPLNASSRSMSTSARTRTRERSTSMVVRIRPTMRRTRSRDFRQACGKATR